MKEPVVSRLLTYALYGALALGAAGTVTLPWMLEYYTGYFYDAYYLQPGYRTFLLAFLLTVAVPGHWILLELIGMLRSIPQEPFVRRNVRALHRMGVLLLVLAVLFFLKCVWYVTFLTMACGVLFVICAMFSFTLSSLFAQAVAFKEENDLTI